MAAPIKFGILTVSDTCFNGTKADTSGPKLNEEIKREFPNSQVIFHIAPDELPSIKECLLKWCDYHMCDVILTTGGTGFSPRDVTPEATRQVIEKEAPGLAYAMVARSLAITEMAMLSRAVCGIRKKTIIANLPGSEKGAAECFGFIKNAIPHAVNVLADRQDLVTKEHVTIQGISLEKVGTISPSKVKLDNVAARNRISPYPLVEVSKATEIIRRECSPTLEIEVIPFEKSANRILAEDVLATEAVPPFRASMKDGYAVKSEDGVGNRIVREVAAAGDMPSEEELKAGEAIRISTGAPVPPGADAVVQVEDTSIVETSTDGTKELSIEIKVAPICGQDIRDIGSDVKVNELVLKKYDRISPAHVGVLAVLGKTEVKVYKRRAVGVISTGNEIKNPKDNVGPGQIRDCNKFTLLNLLKKYYYEAEDCGMAKDDPDSMKKALHAAFSKNDVVITSGGVSMGEFDVLKQVLEQDFDAMIHFARVNMKPGKPTTFATCSFAGKTKVVFGLPGNPVSCGVTCLLFVIPTLRHIERSAVIDFPIMNVIATALENKDNRPEYQRVRVYQQSGVTTLLSTGNQTSSRLNSLVGANGLALVYNYVIPKNSYNNSRLSYQVMLFDV
ncbi:unnamed protein product [Phaedon cochleariae]|uniref:MoaB/Mog domain-containing protein n=1 Tax=Phaedon cochleariae TaxID=80249 RepID=A0A9N9X2Z7_PHACE|nr:unnamed protein product [Phaedon cochleariae]